MNSWVKPPTRRAPPGIVWAAAAPATALAKISATSSRRMRPPPSSDFKSSPPPGRKQGRSVSTGRRRQGLEAQAYGHAAPGQQFAGVDERGADVGRTDHQRGFRATG